MNHKTLQMRDSGINSPFIGFKPFHVRNVIVPIFYPTKRNRPVIR